MTRKKKVTLHELAVELGLTVHTVSKALRGMAGMSEQTRRSVVELANAKGYLTKEQKKSLTDPSPSAAVQALRFVFVVVSEAGRENATHHQLFQGVYERAVALGHTAMMVFLPGSIRSQDEFGQWVESNKIMEADGLFITPNTPDVLEFLLTKLPMPRIMLNFPPAEAKLDSVIWDVYDATQAAVRDLIDKGHRRIMYIGDILETRGFKLRWNAFCATMSDADLPSEPDSHLLEGDQHLDKLSEHFLERFGKFRPTALVTSVYTDLKWIYYAIGKLGLRIPEDCSLVSISTSPFVTDVARPIFLMKECGARSVGQMIQRIAEPDAPYERITLASYYQNAMTVTAIVDEVTS